jgi:DNA-binding LacI/PurR family transcriptional regulator
LMGQSHDETKREKKIVEAMKKHRVDGILVSIAKDTTDIEHFEALKKYDIPVVYFDRVPDKNNTHAVTCRVESGMADAVGFLVKDGHTRIAFINGPKELLTAKERMAGFEQAMKSNHLEINPEFVVHSDLSFDATHRAMERLLTLIPLPTAVITFNDYVALDAMQYSRRMNIKINSDICFVSFANLPFCNYMENPPMASVEQFPYRQGQCATEMLLELLTVKHKIGTPDYFKKVVLEPRLFIHK